MYMSNLSDKEDKNKKTQIVNDFKLYIDFE